METEIGFSRKRERKRGKERERERERERKRKRERTLKQNRKSFINFQRIFV